MGVEVLQTDWRAIVMQLKLWQSPPVEHPIRVSIFRQYIKTKVYVGYRQLTHFLDVMDFVLFTATGEIAESQDAAAFVMTRRAGSRVEYAAWHAHFPEKYRRELIFKMDAGHAYGSVDALAWKWFVNTNKLIAVGTTTDYQSIV